MTLVPIVYDYVVSCNARTAYSEIEMHSIWVLFPESTSKKTAASLSMYHVMVQRIDILRILNSLSGRTTGWWHAPATRTWRGHEIALMRHGVRLCQRLRQAGYVDHILPRIAEYQTHFGHIDEKQELPDYVHHAQRRHETKRILMLDNPVYYGTVWPDLHYQMTREGFIHAESE